MFDINLIYDELPQAEVMKTKNTKLIKRTSVRGIIFDNEKLIMVQTKHGDYKLPGGGVNENESFEQALKREIQEETGFTDVSICCRVGHVIEQNIDWFEDNAYFQLDSYYYICRLNSDTTVSAQKEAYEIDLDYKAVKVDIEEAYFKNQSMRIEALGGREKVDSTKWPRELDGLDREYWTLDAIKNMQTVYRIISQTYDCGQYIKNADRSKVVVDEKEGRANFVTSYDKNVQAMIKERLNKAFPDAVFVGEEEEIHASIEKGYAFIVDPIDGTTNFMKDYHMSCISVGMTFNGKAIAGVVYNPYTEEIFYAQKDKGAYVNDKRISVSKEKIENSVVLFGTSPYNEELRDKTFDMAKKYMSQALDIRRSGSAAIDLCSIAAGRADIYFECILSPWDFAAGSLIVTEAGGAVTTMEGDKLSLDKKCSLLASNGIAKLEQ